MKTKLIGKCNTKINRFDDKLFFCTLLGFIPCWDRKPIKDYINETIEILGTNVYIILKCDVFNGALVNGLRQLISFSFVLDKPPGHKVFWEPEKVDYKKTHLF